MGLTLSVLGSFPLAVCFHPPLTSIGAAAHDVFRLECVDLLTFRYLALAEFLREVTAEFISFEHKVSRSVHTFWRICSVGLTSK